MVKDAVAETDKKSKSRQWSQRRQGGKTRLHVLLMSPQRRQQRVPRCTEIVGPAISGVGKLADQSGKAPVHVENAGNDGYGGGTCIQRKSRKERRPVC